MSAEVSSPFSTTEAAFSGFSLIKREPTAILWWALVRFVCNVVLGVALVTLAADKIDQFTALTAAGSQGSPGEIGRAFAGMLPFFLLVIPIQLGVQAVIYAACYRAFLRPGDHALGYLRLGADEGRMAAVIVLWWLMFMAFLFVLLFAVGILIPLSNSLGGGPAALLALVIALGSIGVLFWWLVRMSLSGAATFDQRQIHLFSTWKMTKGHFWSVFGAYFLAFILMLVVTLLGMALFIAAGTIVALATGSGVSAVGQVFTPDASSLGGYFNPWMIAYLAAESVIAAATYAIIVGPTAAAYQHFRGQAEG